MGLDPLRAKGMTPEQVVGETCGKLWVELRKVKIEISPERVG